MLFRSLGTIGNNFMASVPNHPFIQYALDRVVNQILNHQGDVWFASGPGCITIAFCNYYLDLLTQGLLPEGVMIKTCYEIEKKISIQLPRQYKQSSKSWSFSKGAPVPTYRYPRSSI